MGFGGSARRAVWLGVTVVATVVFLFFAAGTTYSLLAPDYVFADGELPGEAAILIGSLALAALGTHRLRAVNARLRASVPDYGAWLPTEPATVGTDGVDLAAETRRLRRTARRAAALVLVWAAAFAGGGSSMNLAERAAADLLATGVRVAGVVVSVDNPSKGTPSFRVRYASPGGTFRTEEIVRDSARVYHVGEVVTVVYDPADPERVRTTDEPNVNQLLLGFGVILTLTSLAGLSYAVKAALGWRGRARAVAGTGWRLAAVTVVPAPYRSPVPPEVLVRYRDGTGIVLGCAQSTTHTPGVLAGLERRRAWIGGWGPRMVVLFPYGPRRPGPYAIPAYAIVPRLSRSRR